MTYEKKNKFQGILDPWGEHINSALYNKKFLDEKDESTCSMKIIPPNVQHYDSLVMCTFADK
jgi:hypothetical protein